MATPSDLTPREDAMSDVTDRDKAVFAAGFRDGEKAGMNRFLGLMLFQASCEQDEGRKVKARHVVEAAEHIARATGLEPPAGEDARV